MCGSSRWPSCDVLLGHRVQVELRVLRERPQHQLLGLERRVDLLAQDLLVEQVLHPDPEPGGLVGVAGPDPAPGGADLEHAEARLARLVEQLVVRHDQVRVGGDPQAADVDPAAAQLADLLGQHARVHDHAVADRADLARVEDPGRDQVELEDLACPRTIVWPALLPPWKRITRSACSASRSTTFPFPSSPHWAPTITSPGMSAFECRAEPGYAPWLPCAGRGPSSGAGRRRSGSAG